MGCCNSSPEHLIEYGHTAAPSLRTEDLSATAAAVVFGRPRAGVKIAHIMAQFRDLRPEDFELLCELDAAVPKRGLVPHSVVSELPRVAPDECDSSSCGICLSKYEPGGRILKLPCQHAFHVDCVSRWLTEYKNSCPVCGAPADGAAAGRPQAAAPGLRVHERPRCAGC